MTDISNNKTHLSSSEDTSGHQRGSITDIPVMAWSHEKKSGGTGYGFLQGVYVLLLGSLIKQNRKNSGSHKGGDFQQSRKFLSVGQSSARRHPNEVSVHYHHGVSDSTQGHSAQTGCSFSAGSKGRLPILESQQAWPRGEALLPSQDHRAPHGKFISLEQLGPAYVSSKILQNELLLSHSYFKKKKPHFQWKTDPSQTELFPSDLFAFSSAIWSLWMKPTVFPGLPLGPICFNAVSSTVCFGD